MSASSARSWLLMLAGLCTWDVLYGPEAQLLHSTRLPSSSVPRDCMGQPTNEIQSAMESQPLTRQSRTCQGSQGFPG
jgi:hypothetical protein